MTEQSEASIPPAIQNPPPQACQPANPPKPPNAKTYLPDSIRDWKQIADQLGCRQKTINSLDGSRKTPESRPKIKSASEITREQFVCMRALWPDRKHCRYFPVDAQCKKKAQEDMKSWPEFQAYLNVVGKPNASLDSLGPWVHTKMHQEQIPSEPSSKRKAPDDEPKVIRQSKRLKNRASDSKGKGRKIESESEGQVGSSDQASSHTAASQSELKIDSAEDEQIVNSAVISFLMAIESRFHHQICQWSSAREPFPPADFGINLMTARNDGFLKATDSSEIFAIVEAKPDSRSRLLRPKVLWQETAEMVAWFMHDETQSQKPHRYVLISADSYQIFLTTATKKPEYMAYLKDQREVTGEDNPPKEAFLIMQEYGPWNITHRKDMENLAAVMLSIAYEAEEVLKDAPGE